MHILQKAFPIVWRYLLRLYLQTFFLALFSFIAILLIMRFREIARLAALGAPMLSMLHFTWYQVLYTLPIAVPIACLLAAWLMQQRLSNSYELMALRSSGYSLRALMRPVLLLAVVLNWINFYIVSEWGTQAYFASSRMKQNVGALNPLVLLKNSAHVKIPNVEMVIGSMDAQSVAHDVLIVSKNPDQAMLSLVVAKELAMEGAHLQGKHVSVLSSKFTQNTLQYDPIILENQNVMSTSAAELQATMQKGHRGQILNSYLNWNLLAARLHQYQENLDRLKVQPSETESILKVQEQIHCVGSEILRRLYSALAPLSLTYLGMTLGVEIGRSRNRYKILIVTLLVSCFVVSFFMAKIVQNSFEKSLFVYSVPHILIFFVGTWTLKRLESGIEA